MRFLAVLVMYVAQDNGIAADSMYSRVGMIHKNTKKIVRKNSRRPQGMIVSSAHFNNISDFLLRCKIAFFNSSKVVLATSAWRSFQRNFLHC